MDIRKSLYVFIALVLCVVFLATLAIRTVSRTQLKMGTFVDIRLTGFIWDDFDSVFTDAFQAMDEVVAIASLYDSESELSRLNRFSQEAPFKASEGLFYMIYNLDIIGDTSNGAFDITIAPLSILWKSCIKNRSAPGEDDIKQALSLTGKDSLLLDREHRTVFFKKKGMGIDLGAAAKGYAVDKAICEIKRSGFKSAMINAGGDIFCLGKSRFVYPWRVGIRDPYNKDGIYRVLEISDRAVVTSGGYEQFFSTGDRYYSHLINPKTGYPADSPFSSVTVIADTCFLADAIATAVFTGGEPVRSKFQGLYPDIEIIVIEKA
jgi:FAD:protein FMN transferase